MNIIDGLKRPYIFFKELTEREKYDPSISIPKQVKHQGQLKLLLVELFFLNNILKDGKLNNKTILYIGSAPGIHLPWLIKYFKSLNINLEWILIDPKEHVEELNKFSNVEIRKEFFDENTIQEFKKRKNLIFISDIRLCTGKEPTTVDLIRDYALQNKAVAIIQPCAFSLKWRCPFPDELFKEILFITGDMIIQPFAQPTSSELRVLSYNGKYELKLLTYELAKEFEEKLFYYNKNIRTKIVANFDYYNQGYDYFFMYDILKNIVHKNENILEKLKILNIQKRIFNSLGIQL